MKIGYFSKEFLLVIAGIVGTLLLILLFILLYLRFQVGAKSASLDLAAAPVENIPTPTTSVSSLTQPAQVPRMIIRTAYLDLVVKDATSASLALIKLVESKEGYAAEITEWRQNDQPRATLTLRVPAEHLSAVMDSAKQLAIRVERETVSGQDITQEYTDLVAQLKNLEATEVELRELLTTVRQRTQKAADILEVYKELTKVRGEIERMKGRMNYLNHMTALSTLKVNLLPDALAKPVVETGWQPVLAIKNASRALLTTLKWLMELGIWVFIYLVPLAFIFTVIGSGIYSLYRRVRKGKASVE